MWFQKIHYHDNSIPISAACLNDLDPRSTLMQIQTSLEREFSFSCSTMIIRLQFAQKPQLTNYLHLTYTGVIVGRWNKCFCWTSEFLINHEFKLGEIRRPSGKRACNFCAPAGFDFHVRMRLPGQRRSTMFNWSCNSLQTDLIKETCT